MKTLMTLFTGIMLIGCADADHQSTRVALARLRFFTLKTRGKIAANGVERPTNRKQ